MAVINLGTIVVTRGISEWMERSENFRTLVLITVPLFAEGFWGVLPKEDEASNEYAAEHDERVLGSYPIPKEFGIDRTKFWIITEWNRSVTTILFPDEY